MRRGVAYQFRDLQSFRQRMGLHALVNGLCRVLGIDKAGAHDCSARWKRQTGLLRGVPRVSSFLFVG